MNFSVGLKLIGLTLATTVFYTYVGQLVPQKQVLPPQEMELAQNLSEQEMIETGRELMEGKGMCFTCHTVGQSGALRFPDLSGIGSRAATRVPGLNGLEYLVQSLYEPDAYIVPGFIGGMPAVNKPPIGLSEDEIKTILASLQSMGGTVTVSMETNLSDPGTGPVEEAIGAEGPSAGPAAGGPRALLQELDCGGCHRLSEPGEQNGAPSLYNVGSRLSREEILNAILSVEGGHSPAAFLKVATIEDARQIAEHLAAQREQP